MASDCPPPAPFCADAYPLGTCHCLGRIAAGEGMALGEAFAVIDPWARYGIAAERLGRLLEPAADGAVRHVARERSDGPPVGVILLRPAWLVGPYIQFLGVVPAAQGHGLGAAMLAWAEAQSRAANQRNLWICVSAFNAGALRLYRRAGFADAAVFDDLIAPGTDEILLRKRLA